MSSKPHKKYKWLQAATAEVLEDNTLIDVLERGHVGVQRFALNRSHSFLILSTGPRDIFQKYITYRLDHIMTNQNIDPMCHTDHIGTHRYSKNRFLMNSKCFIAKLI